VRVSIARRRSIVSVIVIEFTTMDGIVSDPDGSDGTPAGGWAFASRTLTETSAWANSRVIDGDLIQAVKNEPRDVIITGSLSVVHALFPPGRPPAYLEVLSAEQSGAAVLTRYGRSR
jgi:hypothetical protein